MKFILQPWQLMLIILASWVNRQQQEVIEYLRTENAVLKEKFGKKRILLTDDQRCRLAVKGNRDAIETIISHWRNRPQIPGKQKNYTFSYAKHHIDCFWQILTFIDEQEDWHWNISNSCRRISRTPIAIDADRKKKRTNRIQGVIYSIDQLAVIASHMTKSEKLTLGLMVNCGMQPAEVGRLEPEDFYPMHPERIDPATGEGEPGPWIIFDRPKTFEYGEWILFEEVHQLLRWGIERSKTCGGKRILCNEKGQPLYRDEQRNAAQGMTKWWGEKPNGKTVTGVGVITRVQRIDPNFPKHKLMNLRKVLPNLLRPKYGDEIADLSNARKISRTSITNCYSDPRFGTLKAAILELRPQLEPLLDELARDE